jgi:hypothetical protein
MKKTSLTQAQLKQALFYDSVTGLFRWISRRKNVRVGAIAGNFRRYVSIKLDQKVYMAHRLAWLYMTGRWPDNEIDHKDTNKHNNRWSNLREATRVQNAHNARPMKNKKYTSLKGVTYAKGRRKWQAGIKIKGRLVGLGYFDSAEAAHAAYAQAAIRLRGEFARTTA